MSAKILFNSTTPELTALSREVAAGLKLELDVIQGTFEQGVALARQAIAKNPNLEVAISRGATAPAIQEAVDLPIVKLAPSEEDYFCALRQAREHGQRIGLLVYQPEAQDLDLTWFTQLLDITVQVFAYTTSAQYQAQIAWAAASEMQVLVTRSSLGERLAREAGMVGVVVHTKRPAVVQALERAATVIWARQQEREKSQLLRAVLDHVCDGVIMSNRQGQVTLCNPIAERMLGVNPGVGINDGPPALARLFEDYRPRHSYLVEVGNQRILANRASIDTDTETAGTVVTFQDVTKIQHMEERIRKELYSDGLVAKYCLDDVVGRSRAMQTVLTKTREVASMDSTVLIIGESGTGKELFAQGIHKASATRRNGPFVPINCAALPQSLLESELFGYENGAFTGARKGGKPGLFELAHRGTIFLDEIGTVSLDLQARLLRVLQERQVMRIGGDRVLPVDIRIIAASNEDLSKAITQGQFRTDLYYRLNILRLTVPPLRERRDDIPLLVEHLLQRMQKSYGKPVRPPSERVMSWFCNYRWPGNVRELENILARWVVWSRAMGDAVFLEELEAETGVSPEPQNGEKLTIDLASLGAMEQQILEQAVQRVGGNREALAHILGISRTTLWSKLKHINGTGGPAVS